MKVTDDVFLASEEAIRIYYQKFRIKEVAVRMRDEIVERMLKVEGVLEDWSEVAIDMDEKIGKTVKNAD